MKSCCVCLRFTLLPASKSWLRAFDIIAVVSQEYRTNVLEASVLKGNAAIFKCEIPSFVADFVYVTGWQEESSGSNYFPSQKDIGIIKYILYIFAMPCMLMGKFCIY